MAARVIDKPVKRSVVHPRLQPPVDMRTARSLSGDDIGTEISFEYRFRPGGTRAVILAELRQVNHNSNEVFVNVCSLDEDTAGGMDEFTLSPTAEVWVSVK